MRALSADLPVVGVLPVFGIFTNHKDANYIIYLTTNNQPRILYSIDITK